MISIFASKPVSVKCLPQALPSARLVAAIVVAVEDRGHGLLAFGDAQTGVPLFLGDKIAQRLVDVPEAAECGGKFFVPV